MHDFFEIDFLDVDSKKSGDALALRYTYGISTLIHVVDGGYLETGTKLVAHIKKHYDAPHQVDHVVVTHPDGDHAAGLRQVLEDFNVGALWMLRPWVYAPEILNEFANVNSLASLDRLLREAYPNIDALEEIALRKGIPIYEPFQGSCIGAFAVLAPSRQRYLELIVNSGRTPEARRNSASKSLLGGVGAKLVSLVNLVRAQWGAEIFPDEGTSEENEMSIVQFSELFGEKILLTGDVGREGLAEAIDFMRHLGIGLPGIDRFQVPHHGSRRNLSTELLDELLGQRLGGPAREGLFTAIISASKHDEDHPRKAVVRAMIHRGAKVISTEGSNIRTGHNAPKRDGWTAVEGLPYPEDQEAE